MTWLVNGSSVGDELASWFRTRIMSSPALALPGAHDPLAGLVARDEGFEALYLSGAAFAASRGLPDLGIINSTDVAQSAAEIVRATGLPLLVDIDTGYGSPLGAARAARELADAGVAAVQIEDQTLPKLCGHLSVGRLATIEEVRSRILAIRSVSPAIVCVVRTDARTAEGLQSAVARARAYREAGADMIFPEALQTEDEFRMFRSGVDGPLLANMTEFGKSPALSVSELERLGYAAVIFPVSALRVAAFAYRQAYRTLHQTGSTRDLLAAMLSRDELYALLEYERYATFDAVDVGI